MNQLIQVILLSIAPIVELRGGIPLAIVYNINPLLAFLICTLTNILIIPIVFIFLGTLNKLLLNLSWYSRFFHKTIEKTQHKLHKKVEKYGYFGLMIFAAIPFPGTGAYTGTLGAWALGMDKKKSFAYIALGVIIAGVIVTLISYYGFHILDIFIKRI